MPPRQPGIVSMHVVQVTEATGMMHVIRIETKRACFPPRQRSVLTEDERDTVPELGLDSLST